MPNVLQTTKRIWRIILFMGNIVTTYQTRVTQFFGAVTQAFSQRILFAWSEEKWEALAYLSEIDSASVHKYWDVFGSKFKLQAVSFGFFHPSRTAARCVNAVYHWTVDEVEHIVKVCIVDKKVGFVEFSSLMDLMKSESDEFDFALVFEKEMFDLPDVVDFP